MVNPPVPFPYPLADDVVEMLSGLHQ